MRTTTRTFSEVTLPARLLTELHFRGSRLLTELRGFSQPTRRLGLRNDSRVVERRQRMSSLHSGSRDKIYLDSTACSNVLGHENMGAFRASSAWRCLENALKSAFHREGDRVQRSRLRSTTRDRRMIPDTSRPCHRQSRLARCLRVSPRAFRGPHPRCPSRTCLLAHQAEVLYERADPTHSRCAGSDASITSSLAHRY